MKLLKNNKYCRTCEFCDYLSDNQIHCIWHDLILDNDNYLCNDYTKLCKRIPKYLSKARIKKLYKTRMLGGEKNEK